MATSTVALGKLQVAARWGKAIPAGWALDPQGRPATDPGQAYQARLLTPLGATRELGGHKGYGLAVMVDILCGVLAGAGYGDSGRRGRTDPARTIAPGRRLSMSDPRAAPDVGAAAARRA